MKQQNWKATLEKIFACDLRSLALLRVTIAYILLADWWNRVENFQAFMTEQGLFPRQTLLELYGSPYIWSLYHIATGDWWQWTLTWINLFFILGLFVGYRTRFFTIGCWILQLSIQAKNPILMQSGDVLLRIILFLGIFLPWAGRYSVDSALSKESKPIRIFTYTTMALCLQALYVYVAGVFLKNGDMWRVDGTAVYYALNLDHFSTPFGKMILKLPIEVLKLMNFSVLGWELIAPILLLLPWCQRWIRPFAVLGLWFMHINFGASLAIGNFVLISIASTMPFIPSETWDFIESKLKRETKAKGFYDEDCGFCIKMVAIVREFFFLPTTLFRPAQTEAKVEALMLKEDSWVFENEKGERFIRSAALREALRVSPVFFWVAWLFAIPGVQFIGDFVYKKIAANRARTCDSKNRPPNNPSPVFDLKAIESTFMAFIVILTALWNLASLPGFPSDYGLDMGRGRRITVNTIRNAFEPFALLIRIEQRWEMFAPFPMTDDGWFMLPGKLRDGTEVDIFRNGETITYDKPESVKDMYSDFRWRKYMVNLWAASFNRYRHSYARYMCRTWNESHDYKSQLLSFNIVYMKEDTPPPGEPLPKAEKMEIFNWNCF